MALISINGVDLPTPTDLQVGLMDLSKAERNANGRMIIERVASKVKLFFTYSFLNESDTAFVLTKIAPTTFDVTYLDPKTNTFKSGKFYCGDRNIGMVDFRNGIARYRDLTFNLIEV